jgi:hypothetical protein
MIYQVVVDIKTVDEEVLPLISPPLPCVQGRGKNIH